jgi:hypothetical protein
MAMKFDTKIAVVLRADLAQWQKLNVTAFLVSGIAATVAGVTGEPYEDASGNRYLPMFVQPVLVFAGETADVRAAYERAMAALVTPAIYTEELFKTGFDVANRAAVKTVAAEALNLVGLAFRAERKTADRIVKGLSLHP